MAVNHKPHIHELIICANIFVRKDGKYLLLKRSPKKRFAPNVVHPIGGKVDPNENPYTAAKREVLEEAGITVKNINLEAVLLEIIPHKDLPYNWMIFHFSADYDEGDVTATEEGELVSLSEEEIYKQELFPSIREVIKNILNPNDKTVFATFSYNRLGEIEKKSKTIDVLG